MRRRALSAHVSSHDGRKVVSDGLIVSLTQSRISTKVSREFRPSRIPAQVIPSQLFSGGFPMNAFVCPRARLSALVVTVFVFVFGQSLFAATVVVGGCKNLVNFTSIQ